MNLIDFEHLPGDGPLDETDVNLRAYLARPAATIWRNTTRRGPTSRSAIGTAISAPTAS